MTLPLSYSPADVIRYLIIALGVGTLPTQTPQGNWPTFANQEGDFPDNVVTVYDTTGIKDAKLMTDGEVVDHPGIQIRVRATDDNTANVQAWIVARALDEKVRGYNVQVNGPAGLHNFTVYNVSRITNPIQVGYESPSSRRRIYTVNANVSIIQTQ